jgi:hypothetical protein
MRPALNSIKNWFDRFPYGEPVVTTGDFNSRSQDGLGSVQRAFPGGNPLAVICEVLAVAGT